jgi:hypothetical protein
VIHNCLYCDSELIIEDNDDNFSSINIYSCLNHKNIYVLYRYNIWGDEESFHSIVFKKPNCSLIIYSPNSKNSKSMFISSGYPFWTSCTNFTPEDFEDKIKVIMTFT